MTVPEALQQILARWLARESEIQRRLDEIANERIALTSLLRTVERSRQIAKAACDLAADLPHSSGGPVRGGADRGHGGSGGV